jgi:hypothetical protein
VHSNTFISCRTRCLTCFKMNAIKSLKTKFSRETSKKNMTIVEEPLDYDILLGRGKTSFNHKGNHWFRVFIGLHLRQYMDAKSRMEKTLVVNAVVEAITEAGGRFLKQDSKTEKWVTVGPKKAREKVGHALRDAVGMRVKMAATGKDEGIAGHDFTFARRTSELAIAKARRSSVTESRRVPQLDPNDFARISRSCNDLLNVDEAGIGNNMALNAQRVCLELGENSDDEDDDDDNSNELSHRERSELLFDPGNRHIPDPTPMRNTGRNGYGVKKLTFSSGRKRATNKQVPHETKMASLLSSDKKVFDDRSGELSVMSEGTNKKWFDLGSGEFSVDTNVFDDHDGDETNNKAGLPRDLMAKVSKEVTNLEASGEHTSSAKDKGGSSFFRRKFGKKVVNDVDLSEEFSVMSLDMRPRFEHDDLRLKSEEFGLKPDEYVKANGDRGDFKGKNFAFVNYGLKSDEFGNPTGRLIAFDPSASGVSNFSAMRTSSTDFSVGSSLFDPRNSGSSYIDGAAMRLSSTEFALRASTNAELNDLAQYTSESTNRDMRRLQIDLQTKVSRALDEQQKGIMDTVLEGAVLDESRCDERETIATSSEFDANGSSKNASPSDSLAMKSMRQSLSSEFTMKSNDWHNSVESLLDIEKF